MEQEKKTRGRPRQYEKWSDSERGAPKITIRVDPDVHERIQSRPEGPRAYIESVVRADIASDAPKGDLPLSGKAEQAAEA